MKVALVHDSLVQFGGAERVLQALHQIYPEAPVFTLVYDKKLEEHFSGWKIISSPLQYLYAVVPRFKLMLPFIPLALKFFDFSGFDLVLSSSSLFMKGITVPKGTVHIQYCHTPARFLWLETEQYLHDEVPAILRPLVRLILKWFRKWDYKKARKVDYFLANSKNVQNRIKQVYGRDSEIIYPSIDTDFFYPSKQKENYFLIAGRLQAHKRSDLVIRAFNNLGLELHVVGTGRAVPELKAMSHENILFLGKVEDEILRNEYSGAQAFIFPQEEDLGMMPLEAAACGTPTIAYARGGVLETVLPGKTGEFFSEQTGQAIKNAVLNFMPENYKSEDLFEQAQRFSPSKFTENIKSFVESHAHRS